MLIQTLISEFMEAYIPPARAKKTCQMMAHTLRELVEDERLGTSSDLTPALIWRWLRRRPERTPITAASHLRNIRTFCNHAVGLGLLAASPFSFDSKLRKATQAKKEARRRHHSLAEIGCVLGYLRDRSGESWEGLRLYALAALVAYTGVRALEAQFAEVADFDLVEGFFRVEPKPTHPLKTDSSTREVPIPDHLAKILRRWLPAARSNWAFPGVRKLGPWTGGVSGYRPLDRLKEAGLAVGVNQFTFLSLRHSYMTHGIGPWGMNSGIIQQIAGHSLVDTQRHYLGRDRPNLRLAAATISFPLPARLPSR